MDRKRVVEEGRKRREGVLSGLLVQTGLESGGVKLQPGFSSEKVVFPCISDLTVLRVLFFHL